MSIPSDPSGESVLASSDLQRSRGVKFIDEPEVKLHTTAETNAEGEGLRRLHGRSGAGAHASSHCLLVFVAFFMSRQAPTLKRRKRMSSIRTTPRTWRGNTATFPLTLNRKSFNFCLTVTNG
jgi:hypothetical protein